MSEPDDTTPEGVLEPLSAVENALLDQLPWAPVTTDADVDFQFRDDDLDG